MYIKLSIYQSLSIKLLTLLKLFELVSNRIESYHLSIFSFSAIKHNHILFNETLSELYVYLRAVLYQYQFFFFFATSLRIYL